MPMAGKGMLLTSMDVDAADEAEFNRWYDREHLEERVAIDGFLEARRYIAHQAQPEISQPLFDRDVRGARQPGLSRRIGQPDRVVEGQYRALQEHDPRASRASRSAAAPAAARCSASSAFVPLPSGKDELRAALHDALDPERRDGIISMHLIENDPASVETAHRQPSGFRSRRRRLVCADRRHRCECDRRGRRGAYSAALKSAVISTGVYRLMWDLAKSDISRPEA